MKERQIKMGFNKWMIVTLICASAAVELTLAAPRSGQLVQFLPISREQYDSILSTALGKAVTVEPRAIEGYSTLQNLQKTVSSTWQSLLNKTKLFPYKEVNEKPSDAYPLCAVEASQLEQFNGDRNQNAPIVNCVVVTTPNEQHHETPETPSEKPSVKPSVRPSEQPSETSSETPSEKPSETSSEASASSEDPSDSNTEEENKPQGPKSDEMMAPTTNPGNRRVALPYSSLEHLPSPYPYPVVFGIPAAYRYGLHPYAAYPRRVPVVVRPQPVKLQKSPASVRSNTETQRTVYPNSPYKIQYPAQPNGYAAFATNSFSQYPQYSQAFNPVYESLGSHAAQIYPQYFSHVPQYPASILRTLATNEQVESSENDEEGEEAEEAEAAVEMDDGDETQSEE